MIHTFLESSNFVRNGNDVRGSLSYSMDTPPLDILVREAIQNSSDALLDDAKYLDFSIEQGTFDHSKLKEELTDLPEKLHTLYGGNPEFLAIRDCNTVGLNGPAEVRKQNESGNLIKLVYTVADKQTGEGKGGSHGKGKTNYFNLGIGLVGYYSRTIVNGEYVERLAFCLVEDSDHKKTMLYPDCDSGISFWGVKSKLYADRSIPLEDKTEIHSVLNIFGINPYENEQTGTTILIPFINSKKLALTSFLHMKNAEELGNMGCPDFRTILELTVQRWYFPRLMNTERERFIRFSYNGELLTRERMEPVFLSMQDIYNETFDKPQHIAINGIAFKQPQTRVAEYATRKVKHSEVELPFGLKINELLMLGSATLPNDPIGFRCRSLGMVNRYDCRNGMVKDVPECPADEYQFVCLRPLPDVKIYDKNRDYREVTTLENYIRKGEQNTHEDWSDIPFSKIDPDFSDLHPTIVQTMIQKVNNALGGYKKPAEIVAQRNLGISRALGKLLLPNFGFGKGPSTPPGGGSGGSGGSSGGQKEKNARVGNVSRSEAENSFFLDIPFEFERDSKEFKIRLKPHVTDQSIESIADWEEKTGLIYPVFITSFSFREINGLPAKGELSINSDGSFLIDRITVYPEKQQNRTIALRIKRPELVRSLLVRLEFNKKACKFRTDIDVLEESEF